MATLTERVQKFAIKNNISGFDNVKFSGSSANHDLDLPSAFRFAKATRGRLQSLKDAIVYRVATESADDSYLAQHTRDFALYFRQDGVNRVAFVDGYNFVDNRNRSLISRVGRAGLTAHYDYREWLLSMDDFCPYGVGNGVRVWIDELVERGRCFISPRHQFLETKKPSKKSLEKGAVYFGNHPIITGLLGSNVAQIFSRYLLKKGEEVGRVWFLSNNILNTIPDNFFACRSVMLGTYSFQVEIDCQHSFNGNANARSVKNLKTD